MGIVNAVLVEYATDFLWVIDSASVAQYDRIEDYISVDTRDAAVATAIGVEYLSRRAQPLVSHVVEISPDGPKFGRDFDIGQTLTASADTDLVVVGGSFELDPDGTWRRVPELSSPLQEAQARSNRVFDRLVAVAGGDARASAPPKDTGLQLEIGKLGTVTIPSWSWSSSDELDDQWEPGVLPGDGGQFGQPYEVEEACRAYEWVINCEFEDNDGDQFTWGTSSFELYLNDAPLSPPFIIDIPATEKHGRQDIFGPALLVPGNKLRPRNLVNGGHEGGSITIRATDPT